MQIRPTVLLAAAAALAAGGCAPVHAAMERFQPAPAPAPPVPVATPWEAVPGPKGDSAAWSDALGEAGRRIVVSRDARRLWLMEDDSVLLTAPVAVGRDTIFRYGGRSYDFSTPTGRMTVLDKEEMPLWVPPDWHYFEKAVEEDLEPVQLRDGQRVALSDGTAIEVRDGAVGRVNRYGNWWPFTPGNEIVFDGKVFIPPLGSPQRRIPKVLGTHRLILGDGYLIHGTPDEESIGEWASHGCIRMLNRDVERLYGSVGKGMAVFIY